ncbi:MAG: hypothetical protein ACOZCP_00105 [Pseudomonadota bacterium]
MEALAAGRSLAQSLSHNVRDHVEVVLELLGDASGVTAPAKARLLAHIAEEERSNAQRLNELLKEAGDPPPRELRLIRDHSEMLLDILEGAIPPGLGLRLLHHMMEEHNELLALGREEAPAGAASPGGAGRPGPRLTLGSLRGR